ncbi:hypothetical protein DUI87_09626 [Hirundo rustica rustica]|uniref:Uncharacterized protein n=1 Tax=Hirundo rustica rustica TaxID=333673 RepID=A0A3M0KMR7_HIRRU|nr:hypothetical protein DUI87_09626 [Hirundo rustica rustica]
MLFGVRQGDSDIFVASQPTEAQKGGSSSLVSSQPAEANFIASTGWRRRTLLAEAKFFRHVARQSKRLEHFVLGNETVPAEISLPLAVRRLEPLNLFEHLARDQVPTERPCEPMTVTEKKGTKNKCNSVSVYTSFTEEKKLKLPSALHTTVTEAEQPKPVAFALFRRNNQSKSVRIMTDEDWQDLRTQPEENRARDHHPLSIPWVNCVTSEGIHPPDKRVHPDLAARIWDAAKANEPHFWIEVRPGQLGSLSRECGH